ncbi:Suppressor of Hairy wing [Ladona fulva]|uniref:Suppressor of Hairy wing n=1 Tax=Ladona fulva TaxID=123851 RepID=A0A8K0JY14_LADFU|nr:Suppressor of Hairy wing [Ladona fulva]
MAEKKRITGEKRSGLFGRVAVTPTRTSPRNKLSAGGSKEDEASASAKAKKLVQTRLNFSKSTPKQLIADGKKAEETTTEDPPKKKRGRKPGPKKTDSNVGPATKVDDTSVDLNKQKKGKVNGSEERSNVAKNDQPSTSKSGRGLGKRKSTVKETDVIAEDQNESPGNPLLTYPGDLKCEACQRTFSNSSGFKRHLKYCLDAEGPAVFWKLKKQGASNQTSPSVNGTTTKDVPENDKRMSKDGKGKGAKSKREQTPQPETNQTVEAESGRKTTRKTPQKEKQAEQANEEENGKDSEPESPVKEVRKNARGKAAGKKFEEEQKRRVGRKYEGGKISEAVKKEEAELAKARGSKASSEEKATESYISKRGSDSFDEEDMDAGENSMSSSDSGPNDPDVDMDDSENQVSSRAEKSLREKMKGVMLSKVNELIDETSATAPGKCHCCGEDLETAHLGGEHECDDCGKHFKLRASLDRHRRVIHMQGETHACPECDARCPDKGSLARHMYTHTGLKPYSCVRCKKEFSRKYHLERHIVQTGCDGNPKPTYPCQVCGRMFSRKDNLREHLRAHAGQVKRKKKYSCEYCLKEFHGTSLLRIHVRTHTGERPFECDFCQKGFPSSGAMKKHRRMHTGERPYECKDCFAKFSAKETLNRHARTHTGLKPHVCNYCGKSFIQAAQLRAHIFHHTGENGFTCDHCGKAFNRRARLHMHVKYVHEGARPYECSNCGKTFVRKEDLVRHTVLHSGVKAHKCPICEKSFAMKSSLKIHLLTHTKEPPRSCDECGRAFIRQDCLLRHMRSKHREMLEEILAEAEKKKLQQQLLAATATAAMTSHMVGRGERGRISWGSSRDGHPEDDLEEDDDIDDVPEAGAIDRVLGLAGSESAKAGALLQHLTSMGESAGNSPIPRMETAASTSAILNSLGTSIPSSSHRHQTVEMIQGGGLSESALADSVRELLTLLVDDATLRAFGWPDAPVDKLLEAVIRRCGHQPASPEDYSRPSDRLRENAKLLFTVVIDDSAVKTLLNNQTVDEVILHVLRLAKS